MEEVPLINYLVIMLCLLCRKGKKKNWNFPPLYSSFQNTCFSVTYPKEIQSWQMSFTFFKIERAHGLNIYNCFNPL